MEAHRKLQIGAELAAALRSFVLVHRCTFMRRIVTISPWLERPKNVDFGLVFFRLQTGNSKIGSVWV